MQRLWKNFWWNFTTGDAEPLKPINLFQAYKGYIFSPYHGYFQFLTYPILPKSSFDRRTTSSPLSMTIPASGKFFFFSKYRFCTNKIRDTNENPNRNFHSTNEKIDWDTITTFIINGFTITPNTIPSAPRGFPRQIFEFSPKIALFFSGFFFRNFVFLPQFSWKGRTAVIRIYGPLTVRTKLRRAAESFAKWLGKDRRCAPNKIIHKQSKCCQPARYEKLRKRGKNRERLPGRRDHVNIRRIGATVARVRGPDGVVIAEKKRLKFKNKSWKIAPAPKHFLLQFFWSKFWNLSARNVDFN